MLRSHALDSTSLADTTFLYVIHPYGHHTRSLWQDAALRNGAAWACHDFHALLLRYQVRLPSQMDAK